MSTGPQIGDLLLREGLLNQAELDALLAEQAKTGQRLLSLVQESGHASERELVAVLCNHLGLRAVALRTSVLQLADLSLVPQQVARADLMLPLCVEGGRLHVAVADPASETLDELRFATLLDIVPYCALTDSLQESIAAAWEAKARGETELRGRDAPALARGLDVAHPDLELEVSSAGDSDSDFDEVLATVHVPGSPARRILVVDDEKETCELTCAWLDSRGYVSASAGDAAGALRSLAQLKPDLVLLDAMLPGMHGFDLCAKLKREHPGLQVVMMSAVYRGWRFAEDARETLQADAYVEKPFRLEELLHKIEERLPPDDAAEHRARALALYRRGLDRMGARDHPAAAAAFREAVQHDPQSARAHYQLARSLQEAQEGFTAMHHYERAIDLQPAMVCASRSLAELYLARGFRRKATEILERAVGAARDALTRKALHEELLKLLDGKAGPLQAWTADGVEPPRTAP